MLAGLGGFGCSRPEAARPLRLQVVESRPRQNLSAPEEGLHFAITPIISPGNTLIYYRELLDYVERQLGQPIRIKQRSTYAEVNDLLRRGELEAAFLCSGPYVEMHDEFGAELLVSPEVNGQACYRTYIVVPASSPAQRLEDLRGKSFAWVDPLSHTGYLVPCYLLHQRGENPRTFFGRMIFTHAHDKSLIAVAHQLVEGAAISSLVYDYWVRTDPKLGSQVRILERSGPYAPPRLWYGLIWLRLSKNSSEAFCCGPIKIRTDRLSWPKWGWIGLCFWRIGLTRASGR